MDCTSHMHARDALPAESAVSALLLYSLSTREHSCTSPLSRTPQHSDSRSSALTAGSGCRHGPGRAVEAAPGAAVRTDQRCSRRRRQHHLLSHQQPHRRTGTCYGLKPGSITRFVTMAGLKSPASSPGSWMPSLYHLHSCHILALSRAAGTQRQARHRCGRGGGEGAARGRAGGGAGEHHHQSRHAVPAEPSHCTRGGGHRPPRRAAVKSIPGQHCCRQAASRAAALPLRGPLRAVTTARMHTQRHSCVRSAGSTGMIGRHHGAAGSYGRAQASACPRRKA